MWLMKAFDKLNLPAVLQCSMHVETSHKKAVEFRERPQVVQTLAREGCCII